MGLQGEGACGCQTCTTSKSRLWSSVLSTVQYGLVWIQHDSRHRQPLCEGPVRKLASGGSDSITLNPSRRTPQTDNRAHSIKNGLYSLSRRLPGTFLTFYAPGRRQLRSHAGHPLSPCFCPSLSVHHLDAILDPHTMASQWPARDLVGYGGQPPHPQWPGNAKLALSLCLNYEEGGEYETALGDAHSESYLGEIAGRAHKTARDPSIESEFDYGSRAGVWRVLKMLDEAEMKVSGCDCQAKLVD